MVRRSTILVLEGPVIFTKIKSNISNRMCEENSITYMSTIKFLLNHTLACIVTLDYISIMEILHLLLVKIALKWR